MSEIAEQVIISNFIDSNFADPEQRRQLHAANVGVAGAEAGAIAEAQSDVEIDKQQTIRSQVAAEESEKEKLNRERLNGLIEQLGLTPELEQLFIAANSGVAGMDSLIEQRIDAEEVNRIIAIADEKLSKAEAKEMRNYLRFGEIGRKLYDKWLDQEFQATENELDRLARASTTGEDTQLKAVMTIATQVGRDMDYRRFNHIASAYVSVITAAKNAGLADQDTTLTDKEKKNRLATADHALINGFQRMIDPGVSVREADAQLILASLGYLDRLKRWTQRIGEGGILSPRARNEITKMAKELYNLNYDHSYPQLKQRAERWIDIAGLKEITTSDVMSDLYRENRSLEDIIQSDKILPQAPSGQPSTRDIQGPRVPTENLPVSSEIAAEIRSKIAGRTEQEAIAIIETYFPPIDEDSHFKSNREQQIKMIYDILKTETQRGKK